MLEVERRYFEDNKERLLEHYQGKVALIYGSELIGTYDNDQQAYAEGVRRYGSGPFLTRPISEVEHIAKYPALTLGLIE